MSVALLPNEPNLTTYAAEWNAASKISSSLVLTPFTTKTLYVFGMMRHLLESSGWSLKHSPPYQSFYISAYLLSCGAIELLGRCVSGDAQENSGAMRRLKCGLKQIANIPQNNVDDNQIVVITNHKSYTISDCAALRNFCAHGGSVGHVGLDVEFVDEVLKKTAHAMDDYWIQLESTNDNIPRENLSEAAITPIFAGGEAIFVRDMYQHFQSKATPSANLMVTIQPSAVRGGRQAGRNGVPIKASRNASRMF